MAKTNIKKIAKLSFLITLKEAYLLSKNSLGLIYHPFLTLNAIKSKGDKSQTILISLVLLTIFGIIPLVASGLFFFIYKVISPNFSIHLNKIVFFDLYLIILGGITFLYLTFWLIKVLTAERKS